MKKYELLKPLYVTITSSGIWLTMIAPGEIAQENSTGYYFSRYSVNMRREDVEGNTEYFKLVEKEEGK